jgi:hypothetical protein
VQLIFFLLYGNMQVAFAFLLSCFFSNSRTAVVTTWIWVAGSGQFAANLLDGLFAKGHWWVILLELIPTAGAYRCASACRAHTHAARDSYAGILSSAVRHTISVVMLASAAWAWRRGTACPEVNAMRSGWPCAKLNATWTG